MDSRAGNPPARGCAPVAPEAALGLSRARRGAVEASLVGRAVMPPSGR